MKTKHWIFLAFLGIGVLFVLHNYQSHGGIAGIRQGLGFGYAGS